VSFSLRHAKPRSREGGRGCQGGRSENVHDAVVSHDELEDYVGGWRHAALRALSAASPMASGLPLAYDDGALLGDDLPVTVAPHENRSHTALAADIVLHS